MNCDYHSVIQHIGFDAICRPVPAGRSCKYSAQHKLDIWNLPATVQKSGKLATRLLLIIVAGIIGLVLYRRRRKAYRT